MRPFTLHLVDQCKAFNLNVNIIRTLAEKLRTRYAMPNMAIIEALDVVPGRSQALHEVVIGLLVFNNIRRFFRQFCNMPSCQLSA